MPTKAEVPTISTPVARWMILIGVCLTSIGIAVAAQLERDARPTGVVRTGFLWNVLEKQFLVAILIGLVLAFIGSATWAWRVPTRRIVWCGTEILILAPIVYAFIPINVHGYLAVLMLVFPVVLVIGALFLIIAAIRTFAPRQDGSIPE